MLALVDLQSVVLEILDVHTFDTKYMPFESTHQTCSAFLLSSVQVVCVQLVPTCRVHLFSHKLRIASTCTLHTTCPRQHSQRNLGMVWHEVRIHVWRVPSLHSRHTPPLVGY